MAKIKLNDRITDKICENIEEGIPQKYSAQAAGISKSTFYAWLERGKKAKSGKFREFYERIQDSKSKDVVWHVKNIRKGCKKRPELSLEWLARTHHKEFGKKEKSTKVNVHNTNSNVVDFADRVNVLLAKSREEADKEDESKEEENEKDE